MNLPLILIKSPVPPCMKQPYCFANNILGSADWFATFLLYYASSLSLVFIHLSPSMFDAEPNVKCNDYCSEEEDMNSRRPVERSDLRAGF